MTRRVLLVEIGTPAELPVVTPPAPRPPSSWVPDPRPSPGLPPPTGLAVESVADAAVLTWTPSVAGGQTIIEAAPDNAGSPGIWREVDRTGADTYTLSLPGGARWARVRAELNGRTSVATNAVLAEPIDVGGSISEFEQELRDIADQVDTVAAQAAADAAALNARADDLRDDIDATIAEVSTLADLTEDLGTEITRVETESISRDTATVETIDLLGAKNADGTAFILDGDTLRLSPTETLAQWRNSIQGEFASQSSRIDNEAQARQDGDQALATTLATVQATANNAATKAELTSAQSALAAADQALGERIDITQARIGGGQLLLNGDFETEDGWATSAALAAVGTFGLPAGFVIEPEDPFSGSARLLVGAGPDDRRIYNFILASVEDEDSIYLSYMARVAPIGGVYPDAGCAARLGVQWYDAGGAGVGRSWLPSIVSAGASTNYAEFSGEVTPPAGARLMRVLGQAYGGTQTGGQFKIDAIRAERRGPAQRVLASDLQATSTQVSQHGDTLSAHALRLDAQETEIEGKASTAYVQSVEGVAQAAGSQAAANLTSINGLTATVGDQSASINEVREVQASMQGVGIVANASFEDGGAGWDILLGGGVEIGPWSAARTGNNVLTFNSGHTQSRTVRNTARTPVVTGQQIRFGAWLRYSGSGGNIGAATVLVSLSWNNSTGGRLTRENITISGSELSTSWQKFDHVRAAPAGAATANIEFWVSNHQSGSGTIRIDDAFIDVVSESLADVLASYVLAMNAGNKVSGLKFLNDGSVSNATFLFDNFDFETADGSFRISDGRTITRSNGYMRVEGKPFGQNNEMVVWYGPEQSNLANCRRNNAISFETNTGLHYSRGAMFSGTITNGGHSTGVATTSYTTGPFATNGDPIVVNVSFTHSRSQFSGGSGVNMNRFSYGSGSNSATIELWRRIGTGSWQMVASETRAGVLNIETPTEPGVPDHAMWNNTVGINYTDNIGGTASREYEIRLISNTFQGIVITGGHPQPPAEDSRAIGVLTSE